MKIQYILITLLLGVIFIFQVACKKEKVPELPTSVTTAECPDTISYQAQIKTMLDINCSTSGCHASGAGGITLLTHAQVSASADDILGVIRHDSGFSPMPQGQAKLPDSVANQVSCWINQGKQNN